MPIKKDKVKAAAQDINVNGKSFKHIVFEKVLDSAKGSQSFILAVQLQKSLGKDISVLNTHQAGHIAGLTGEEDAVAEVLKYLDVDYGN